MSDPQQMNPFPLPQDNDDKIRFYCGVPVIITSVSYSIQDQNDQYTPDNSTQPNISGKKRKINND